MDDARRMALLALTPLGRHALAAEMARDVSGQARDARGRFTLGGGNSASPAAKAPQSGDTALALRGESHRARAEAAKHQARADQSLAAGDPRGASRHQALADSAGELARHKDRLADASLIAAGRYAQARASGTPAPATPVVDAMDAHDQKLVAITAPAQQAVSELQQKTGPVTPASVRWRMDRVATFGEKCAEVFHNAAEIVNVMAHPISMLLGSMGLHGFGHKPGTKGYGDTGESEIRRLSRTYGRAGAHVIAGTATLLAAVTPPGVSHLVYWTPELRSTIGLMPGMGLMIAASTLAQGTKYAVSAARSGLSAAADKVKSVFPALTRSGRFGKDQRQVGFAVGDDAGDVPLTEEVVMVEAKKLIEWVNARFVEALEASVPAPVRA